MDGDIWNRREGCWYMNWKNAWCGMEQPGGWLVLSETGRMDGVET